CTTLTVRLVRNARLTRTSADVSVGVLDWDSNRFLEAFFAIPMMGAVLQTVNVRLSPEQIAYTIDHAGASTLLVNDEFVELVHSILPRLSKVKQVVILSDRQAPTTGQLGFVGEYEELLAAASPDYEFPDFDEDTQATTFYTTGTTGLRRASTSATGSSYTMAELALFGLAAKQGRFARDASICRSRRCTTFTRGASRGRRRSPVSNRSTPDATILRCYSG